MVAVVFALAPDTVTRRMMSVFDLQDPSNRDRVAMLSTGVAMTRAHPLTGVGPNMVPEVYVQYRAPGAVEPVNPHLHNVPMQIAAERGIPALGVFIWFVVSLARALMRMFRDRPEPGAVGHRHRRRSSRCSPRGCSSTTSATRSS